MEGALGAAREEQTGCPSKPIRIRQKHSFDNAEGRGTRRVADWRSPGTFQLGVCKVVSSCTMNPLQTLCGVLLVVTLVGAPVGLIVLISLTLWLIYRIARGWLRLVDKQPMYK